MRLGIVVGCAVLVAATSGAVAGTPNDDPAFKFAASWMLGDVNAASKVILEPITQDQQLPVVKGKDTLSTSEFFGAIGKCEILEVRNRAPSSISYEVAADLRVVWDCGAYAVDARVKSVAYSVDISQLRKVPFVPMLPSKPKEGGSK